MSLPHENSDIVVDLYDKDHPLSTPVAARISEIFLENYPEMYPEESRNADRARYATAALIQGQVSSGNAFMVASLGQKIVAIQKFRLENRSHITNAEEWLDAWVMVDRPYRHQGIGTALTKRLSQLIEQKKAGSERRFFIIGDVHKDNHISRDFFRKLEFQEEQGKGPEYVLVRREVL